MTLSQFPAAVLWDMDGTLIDSEPYWMDAEKALADRFDVPWSHEDALALVGNPLNVSAQILIDRGVRLTPVEVIDSMVREVSERAHESMPWILEARSLLQDVASAGIPCALVTMSIGSLVEQVVERSSGVFAAVVTGDQVVEGKPHPEGYLLAAQRLGVDPLRCVAIEDSPVGIRAAHASGAATIAVPRYTPDPDLPGVTVLKSLEGLGLLGLTSIFATHLASMQTR